MARLLSYNKPEWLLGQFCSTASMHNFIYAKRVDSECRENSSSSGAVLSVSGVTVRRSTRPFFVPAVLGALAEGAAMPAAGLAVFVVATRFLVLIARAKLAVRPSSLFAHRAVG